MESFVLSKGGREGAVTVDVVFTPIAPLRGAVVFVHSTAWYPTKRVEKRREMMPLAEARKLWSAHRERGFKWVGKADVNPPCPCSFNMKECFCTPE